MTGSLRAYLDLGIALTWRELVIRYKRSSLGVLWALADPAFQVVIYLLVFGVVLDAGRGLTGYALFTTLGLLPWLFLSMGADQAAGVLLEHSLLIRKIAFPHELLIISVLISRLTSLLAGIAFAIPLAVLLHVLGYADPAWGRLPYMLPGLLLLGTMTLGLSLAASALQVVLGDVQYIVRFGLRLGFYACPIVYPLSRVPALAQPLYELNPLVAILWCFQGISDAGLPPPSPASWAAAVVGSLGTGLFGWWSFRRLRGVVAELV